MPISPLAEWFQRYPVHRIVSYHRADKRFLTLTVDLGMNGMRIETHHHLPHDEELDFQLVLGEDSVWSKGRVVRSDSLPDNRIVSEIEFTQLSEQNLTILQKYLPVKAG